MTSLATISVVSGVLHRTPAHHAQNTGLIVDPLIADVVLTGAIHVNCALHQFAMLLGRLEFNIRHLRIFVCTVNSDVCRAQVNIVSGR